MWVFHTSLTVLSLAGKQNIFLSGNGKGTKEAEKIFDISSPSLRTVSLIHIQLDKASHKAKTKVKVDKIGSVHDVAIARKCLWGEVKDLRPIIQSIMTIKPFVYRSSHSNSVLQNTLSKTLQYLIGSYAMLLLVGISPKIISNSSILRCSSLQGVLKHCNLNGHPLL